MVAIALIATALLATAHIMLVVTVMRLTHRLKRVEVVAMYLGLERYQQIVAEAEESARSARAQQMIDREWPVASYDDDEVL